MQKRTQHLEFDKHTFNLQRPNRFKLLALVSFVLSIICAMSNNFAMPYLAILFTGFSGVFLGMSHDKLPIKLKHSIDSKH